MAGPWRGGAAAGGVPAGGSAGARTRGNGTDRAEHVSASELPARDHGRSCGPDGLPHSGRR